MASVESGRLSRRQVGAAAGTVGATLALAACGPGGTAGDATAKQLPPRSVPLTLWARGVTDKAVFDSIAPLVEQRYPHLNVTTEATSNIFDKLVVALAGGGAPDLSVVNMPFFAPMSARNTFVNLQRYLAKDRAAEQELKSFAPPGLQTYRVKNDLHAVPLTSETIVFWYNEDLLRQTSLAPPHEFENDPQKWHWETMLSYAQKLNRGRDQDRPMFGLSIGENRQSGWGNLVYSNDGRVISDDGTKMVIAQSPAVEAIQWAVDTIWRHDVAPQLATLRTTLNRQLFAAGRLAMLIEGEFFRRYLFGPSSLGPAFKFNLAQIPFAPRTRKRYNVYHALALPILQVSRQPDAAWQYLTVFMTEPAQQFITDGWGSRGANQKTHEPWLKSNAGGGPPANYAAIVKSDAHGIRLPISPYLDDNELNEPLQRLMPQVYDNKLPVREGLQQIERETNVKLEPAVRAAGAAK